MLGLGEQRGEGSVASIGRTTLASVLPLCYLDVSVPHAGVLQLALYEGNSAERLARVFCTQHALGTEHMAALVGIIETTRRQHQRR